MWHVNDWVQERARTPCVVASADFVRSSRSLQRACVRLLLLQKAKMDGHVKGAAFEERASRIVDDVVAERKLNDILVSLYKDDLTQYRAESLAASVIAILPKAAQPTFTRQFPDLFEKREKSGELSIHTQGVLKPDRHGNTALHRAAAAGEVDKVNKLLKEARACDLSLSCADLFPQTLSAASTLPFCAVRAAASRVR